MTFLAEQGLVLNNGAVPIKRSHPTLLKEEDDRVLILPDGSDTVY
jgi:hypothetical protein